MNNHPKLIRKRVQSFALALVLLSLLSLSTAAAPASGAKSQAEPDTYTFGSQERIRTWTLFDPSDKYHEQYQYCVAVNTKQNLVIVYAKNFLGKYAYPEKAFVCSCGKAATPTKTGTFYTQAKYRWALLNGNVYGQYATRITGPYLFHSVPYKKKNAGTLKTAEYNKLGKNASEGCVRLCVRDVKWLYDHLPVGTMVRIYSSPAAEPAEKPDAVKIDPKSKNAGWDPTDPSSNNPWKS